MNKTIAVLGLATLTLALGACTKPEAAAEADAPTQAAEPAATAAEASTPEPAPAAAATDAAPAEPSPEDAKRTEAQAKLDYATMEDGYINDAGAQWAVAAKASTSFGKANEAPADSQDTNTPWQATGPVNGNTWLNNQQDIGFDWLQLDYERPVSATAVRAVLNTEAAESIAKLELIAADGTAHTVWSGVSDTKRDKRGPRTWFVRTFEATPYQVKSVKLTFANNVSSGYKEVDAVQLVGK